ncbi:MAG: DUF4430 domain-containing protein [Clostridiales bacterium]|nr:DUF4430 domain-containing protein [Clostridiales bacterium]
MKLTTGKIIAIIVIIAILIAAFCFGGDFASKDKEKPVGDPQLSVGEIVDNGDASADAQPEPEVDLPGSTDTMTTPIPPEEFPWPEGMEPTPGPGQDQDFNPSGPAEEEPPAQEPDRYGTEPTPEGKPAPVEPQDVVISDTELTCTISVRCDLLLENLDKLDPNKVELVPADGVILAPIEVTFYEGESAFNVLQREMKKNKIHLEFVNTPVYNSAYIEGIANIYEFDCGELSGWMYKVNDWFPNYGSSRYQLQDGDTIVYVYSCDLGRDVGAEYLGGMQKDE